MYGSNKHEFSGDKTDLLGGGGFIGYGFGHQGSKIMPSLISGLGVLNHKSGGFSVTL